MPRIVREAEIAWEGTVSRGAGCPFAVRIRASATVTVEATLEGGA